MNSLPLSEICEKFSQGEFVIVWDEKREVEGDFFLLAKHATPEKVNFLLKNGGGLLCISIEKEDAERLKLPLMVENNEEQFATNFTVTINAKHDVSSGISAADRAKTIQLLGDPDTTADHFVRPGHVSPLQAQSPDVRWGHTEAAVTLAKKCGAHPAVLICEILNEAGEKASREELIALAKKFTIATTTLENLRQLTT